MPKQFVSSQRYGGPHVKISCLLPKVSQRYADTKSYHIEAVEERTSSNELQHG